ncbi:MAG: hypothetical protein PV344_08965, partial [Anaplasma sp.]|nr:hypothetical protein [Anaplasma sp.]
MAFDETASMKRRSMKRRSMKCPVPAYAIGVLVAWYFQLHFFFIMEVTLSNEGKKNVLLDG